MSWYKVTKNINGRLYDYWQRTFRVGKTTKTENKYIGPSSKALSLAPKFDRLDRAIAHAKQDVADKQRREDELIQYGPLAARIARQKAAVRVAKRNTKGIKANNPFLAQALVKKP